MTDTTASAINIGTTEFVLLYLIAPAVSAIIGALVGLFVYRYKSKVDHRRYVREKAYEKEFTVLTNLYKKIIDPAESLIKDKSTFEEFDPDSNTLDRVGDRISEMADKLREKPHNYFLENKIFIHDQDLIDSLDNFFDNVLRIEIATLVRSQYQQYENIDLQKAAEHIVELIQKLEANTNMIHSRVRNIIHPDS